GCGQYYSYDWPDFARSTSEAGGVKCSPYFAASSSARSTKPVKPPSYWLTYWRTPPVHAGNPMPKIDPILASGTEVSTPSSRHLIVSIASAKSIRSCGSAKG